MYNGGANTTRPSHPSSVCGVDILIRNNTSFPVQVSARLRDLFTEYQRLGKDAKNGKDDAATPEALAAVGLKYYQFMVRSVMTNPEYGIGKCGNARGLLIYHTMGMGKTFLAVATAMALWDVRAPVVLAPKSLQKNFRQTVEKFVALMSASDNLSDEALNAKQSAAVRRFQFVSLDAYNMATQIAKVTSGTEGSGTLNNRLLIVDEAHNLFRGIINSPSEKTNARRLYEMVMEANNLRILFLTGTPASKDPFELVPCFNMLTGYDILPIKYEVFYKHYVDKRGCTIKNRGKLANRLLGLVSHVTHTLPSDPGGKVKDSTEEDDTSDQPQDLRTSGGFPEELKMIIERVEMSAEQYRQYLLAREKEEAEGKGGEGGFAPNSNHITNTAVLSLPGTEAGAGSTYYVKSRSLSNFTPPWGERDHSVSDMPNDAFNKETSPKAVRLIENLAKSPGPTLIYSQFVDIGGLAIIARFLQNAGYIKYQLPGSTTSYAGIAMPEQLKNEDDDCCTGGALSSDYDSLGSSKATVNDSSKADTETRGWKYAIISGNIKPEDRVRIQEIFNSSKNAHGELIKVLLISKTGAEGLDLKGVRQVHIFEPYWDKSREDQVKARGVRLGSHDHLPDEERQVQPFLYISIANQKMFEGMQPTAKDKEAPSRHYKLIEEKTIDELFHQRALNKDALNREFRKLLSNVALECSINGYGGCRLCIPTDTPLFHEDPVRDLQRPDPCQPLEEAEVSVQEITLKGDDGSPITYYYRKDPSTPFGVRFFKYDTDLDAYSPVDPSTELYMQLYEALQVLS